MLNPDKFTVEDFNVFKFMSAIGNYNVIIEQFNKLLEGECHYICEMYSLDGF